VHLFIADFLTFESFATAAQTSIISALVMVYRQYSFFFFMGLFHIINWLWVLMLFVMQTYQTAANLTSYERQNWFRYPYLLDENRKFRNPFDRGVIGNFKEVIFAQKNNPIMDDKQV
jgi:hypothetical protein